MVDSCGNCDHDCCCSCFVKDNTIGEKCRLCQRCGGQSQEPFRRDDPQYPRHLICFTCRVGWKRYSYYNESTTKGERCSRCNMPPTEVSHKVRIPKKDDKQGWLLLQQINDTTPFRNSPVGSLAEFWYYCGGLASTSHLLKSERQQFYTPHKNHEYNDWIQFMKNTKLVKSPRAYDSIQNKITLKRLL